MDEPRVRAGRPRIGLLVAVPLAGAALWAGLAMAATGPTKSDRSPVKQAKPARQHDIQRQNAPRVKHDGRQCPFKDIDTAAASL